ncbi:hypothetical protein LTR78_004280 [Recurvomyces mirabilis]|uniref:Uncharacterized protein n=1 Tax=Recurvomyces mirabilis TaxID=574656 RepID=A0AAE1C2F6_9PEZI|nr:hypothetical protein LTR78_004280 [Recurvomyces mirabilis]KAK5156052.1 hypothetical protein LTS14_005618 [Recurvomyces mirabilis]
MAPGDNGGGKLSWQAVKKLCTPGDIDRLACLAVAHINGADQSKVYHVAAQQFGGNIKPESYKRGMWVISKKIKDAGGAVDSGNEVDGRDAQAKTKGGAKRGPKRKACSESSEGEKKPKRAKKSGIAASAAVEAEGEEATDPDLDGTFT